jgi:hypothetical protein
MDTEDPNLQKDLTLMLLPTLMKFKIEAAEPNLQVDLKLKLDPKLASLKTLKVLAILTPPMIDAALPARIIFLTLNDELKVQKFKTLTAFPNLP